MKAKSGGRKLADADSRDKQKYRAPALEKGLDVLELLAAARDPIPMIRISNELKRSASELFRMVQVLVYRGYVVDSPTGEGFTLSDRLFLLGMTRAPTKDVLKLAQPHMRTLTLEVNQSCHIAVASGDQMVVVSRMESPGDLGFSVREGFRRPIVESTSGLVLFAFQPPEIRSEWKTRLARTVSKKMWAQFEGKAEEARNRGFVRMPSDITKGIVDLSAPILYLGRVAAALTCPHVDTKFGLSIAVTAAAVRDTAQAVSATLAGTLTRS